MTQRSGGNAIMNIKGSSQSVWTFLSSSNTSLWITPLSILVLIVLSGCASSHYTVLEPASQPVTDFSVLEISDFKSNLSDADSIELADLFADQLYAAVITDREAHPGESIMEEVVRSTDQIDDVLVIEGTVISFEKGSRAKRYFIGFGAGKAYCTIQARFKNKATGEEVLKTNFDGELSMSIFGGSPTEAVDAVVKSFIDYFDDYFEEQGIKPQ
jgi:hypothetical protein